MQYIFSLVRRKKLNEKTGGFQLAIRYTIDRIAVHKIT